MPSRPNIRTVDSSPAQPAPGHLSQSHGGAQKDPATALEPLTVRIPTAIKLIGIGRTKIYELIASGDIEIVKVGNATLITMASLRRLVARGEAG